jgi:ATP-dependent Lon protease
MFIATANIKTEIPAPLLDRLEVIDLAGYIPEEKLQIAIRHLAPRQRKDHGLTAKQLAIAPAALKRVIGEYTHEAGVRELDRLIGKICRKQATQIVRGQKVHGRVGAAEVPAMLGPAKIHDDRITRRPKPGVAVGLAWTPVGGDVLFIESALMPGKGGVKVTGQLGEVMSESANLAVSYVRSRASELGVDVSVLNEHDLHLHFPAGAVRKDGPSAGVTVTTALVSLLSGQAIAPRLAMTGEITLRGEVLPVGGIREKVVAARRAGIRTVVLPERNRADVEEIPEEVREQITFVFAADYEDVRRAAFGDVAAAGRGSAPAGRGKLASDRSRARAQRKSKAATVPRAGAAVPRSGKGDRRRAVRSRGSSDQS